MSPRNAEQNAQLREDARARILHAALNLFAERSYAQTTMAEIARAAGMAKGSVYHYFNSKEELLLQLFDQINQDAHHLIPEPKEGVDPRQALREIIDRAFQSLKVQLPFFRLIAMLSLQAEVIQGLQPRIHQMRHQKLSIYKPLFNKLGVADTEAEMFFLGALLDGIILGLHTLGEEYPLAAIQQKLYAHYQL